MVATRQDQEGGAIAHTLRLSITGECNLSCFYCKPLGHSKDLNIKPVVQPSDVTKLIRIVGEFGVTKVVLGGGEPLLRKDAANFIKSSFAHRAIQEVRLVTNGTHLKAHADLLRKMGLRKVDINFDSLDFRKYHRITGEDKLYRVLDGIEKVEKLSFTDIRLNVLLLAGVNDDELIDFARLTKERRVHLRFVEYHPDGHATDPYANRPVFPVLSAKRIIDNFQALLPTNEIEEGLVPSFRFADGIGKISFLSRMEIDAEKSEPRVLFDAEGRLSNETMDGKPQPILDELRRDAKEDKLHRLIERILLIKPSLEKKKPIRAPQIELRNRSARSRQASARR